MKAPIAILLTLTMLLAGCFGGAEEMVVEENEDYPSSPTNIKKVK